MRYIKSYEGIKDFFKKKPQFAYPNDSDKQYWITNVYHDLIIKYDRFFEDSDTKKLYFVFKTMWGKNTKEEGNAYHEMNFSEDNWQTLRGENRIREATEEEKEFYEFHENAMNYNL